MCPVRGAVVVPLAVDDRRRRHAGRGHLDRARTRAGAGRAGDRPLGVHPAGAGRAGLVPGAAGPGRGAGAAGADQPALHLQRADRDRLVRPHRPGAGPRADPGVRRVHPVLVPRARRVHHAGRGAALDRPLPDHRAGPVRRPAAGAAADRAGGAAGGAAVPVPAAAGGERGPARAVAQDRASARSASWPRTPAPTATSRSRTTGSGWTRTVLRPADGRPATPGSTSAWPTSTTGCGRSSATSSGWWWRPRPARARR